MHINVIHVGALKSGFLTDGVHEYEKRLSVLSPVKNILITEERLPENPSQSEIDSALQKEGISILRAIPTRTYTVALCVEGRQLASEGLAEIFEKIPHEGYSGISFIIGSSHGLYNSVKSSANFRLSFSKMTFPHQLMRLMLLEQVYRAVSINAGSKYHK